MKPKMEYNFNRKKDVLDIIEKSTENRKLYLKTV